MDFSAFYAATMYVVLACLCQRVQADFKRSFVFTDNFRVKQARVSNKILKIDLISKVLKFKNEESHLIKIQ